MKLYVRLLRFLRPYLKVLVPLVIFMFLFAALSGLSLTMIVPLANLVFMPQGTGQPDATSWMVFLPGFLKDDAKNWLLSGDRFQNLKNLCLFILVIFLLKNLFEYLERGKTLDDFLEQFPTVAHDQPGSEDYQGNSSKH